MKRIVLRYGLMSGILLMAMSAVLMPLCFKGVLDFDHSEVLGYSSMVLAFLLVFFGIRSYRDNVLGGVISFGKAFQVGILITLVTCAMYVIVWQITYYGFFPDFLDRYNEHALARMRANGESEAAIHAATVQMAEFAKLYANPFFNVAITFLEVFPVGLIMTLVSAAIARRKPGEGAPASVTAAGLSG